MKKKVRVFAEDAGILRALGVDIVSTPCKVCKASAMDPFYQYDALVEGIHECKQFALVEDIKKAVERVDRFRRFFDREPFPVEAKV